MADFPHWLQIVILIAVGVMLILAEFFVPGLVLGTLGVASLIGALVITFKYYPDYGALVALIEIVGVMLLVYAGVKLFPKSPIGKRLILNTAENKDEGYTGAPDTQLSRLAGQRGKAITMLRPAGFAQFGDDRIDVVTQGEFIDPGVEIEVMRIEGNRVIVKAV